MLKWTDIKRDKDRHVTAWSKDKYKHRSIFMYIDVFTYHPYSTGPEYSPGSVMRLQETYEYKYFDSEGLTSQQITAKVKKAIADTLHSKDWQLHSFWDRSIGYFTAWKGNDMKAIVLVSMSSGGRV